MSRGSDPMNGYRWMLGFDPYQQNDSINREKLIGRMLANAIGELAMNRFKWSGLPDSIDPRFLEMTLFQRGLALYYRDPRYDKDLVVRASGTAYQNVFNNPVAFTAITPGQEINISGADTNVLSSSTLLAYDPMLHSKLSAEEKATKAVPIWANYTRTPEWDKVIVYSTRLAQMDRSIEINSKNSRRSKIIKSTGNTRLSVANANRQVDQGDDIVMVTGALEDLNWIDAIDMGINPDSYEKLHILRTRTWNECMGLLGIDNANQDKKERLVAAEVGANDAQTDSMRYVALNARRLACSYINDVFGQNISVDFNTEIEAQAQGAANSLGVDGDES